MRRQPEVGSALGLTTDRVVAQCDKQLTRLRLARALICSELATATDAILGGHDPMAIAARLNRTTGHILDGRRQVSGMDPGDFLPLMAEGA